MELISNNKKKEFINNPQYQYALESIETTNQATKAKAFDSLVLNNSIKDQALMYLGEAYYEEIEASIAKDKEIEKRDIIISDYRTNSIIDEEALKNLNTPIALSNSSQHKLDMIKRRLEEREQYINYINGRYGITNQTE
jgi:hypothetical protein